MPAKTDYARKTKWKNEPYRGERSVGGNFVYAGDNLLDKHLFVHRAAPGGFDWGPNASNEKACQLALALLAPLKGVDYAVKHCHLFAENFVRRELTDDTWEITRKDYRSKEYVKTVDGRDYPESTVPGPEDVPDLEDTDLKSITYAEEIALAEKYEEVLWRSGNRRENLHRLKAIWNGEEDPASDSSNSLSRWANSQPGFATGEITPGSRVSATHPRRPSVTPAPDLSSTSAVRNTSPSTTAVICLSQKCLRLGATPPSSRSRVPSAMERSNPQ